MKHYNYEIILKIGEAEEISVSLHGLNSIGLSPRERINYNTKEEAKKAAASFLEKLSKVEVEPSVLVRPWWDSWEESRLDSEEPEEYQLDSEDY